MVFDGAPLQAKRGTEDERAKSRADALIKAREFETSGNKMAAQALYAKAVDVTPEMAFEVSEALKPLGVQVLVAPYEADAQLGYLSRNGFVDAIISEDSDLLVYGCKRVLYKLDFKTERGQEISLSRVSECSLFARLTSETFLLASVIAGCDYVPSLACVGLTTALKLAAKAEAILGAYAKGGIDSDWFLDRLLMLIRLSGIDEASIGEDFVSNVQRAIRTFKHQTVFCPTKRCLVHLSPIEEWDDISFLGEFFDDTTASLVADCLVHPETKLPFSPVDLVQDKSEEEKRRPKKKLKPFPRPVDTDVGNHKTLMQLWSHQVPFSSQAMTDFVNPVIDLLSDADLSEAEIQEAEILETEVEQEDEYELVIGQTEFNEIQLETLDQFASRPPDRQRIPTSPSERPKTLESLDSFKFGN